MEAECSLNLAFLFGYGEFQIYFYRGCFLLPKTSLDSIFFLWRDMCIKDHYTESLRNFKADSSCMDQCLKHLRADLGLG